MVLYKTTSKYVEYKDNDGEECELISLSELTSHHTWTASIIACAWFWRSLI